MPPLADLQRRFAESVIDPEMAPPASIAAWNGAAASRFAVYRNNVTVGLIEALGRRFPVCERLVGQEFFRAMARDFARSSPPRSPRLSIYGETFADFIASFEPAGSVPYLADVARLEYAYGRAYHAADAAPLPPACLQAIPQDDWDDLVFELHPSLELMQSSWPIVSIWVTNTYDAEVKPIDLSISEDALIVRPDLDVEVRRLSPGGYVFLAALKRRDRLVAAAEAGAAASSAFDATANLAGLMQAGLAIDVRIAKQTSDVIA